MTSILGYITLWLSLFFASLQFLFSYKFSKFTLKYNLFAVYGLLISSISSFFILMFSHIKSDFSIANVYQNSHTTKPLIYKISGVWGNHEGSMLLWILVLTMFNYFIFRLYNKKNLVFVSKTLKIQAFIIIGFLLFTLFTSNPFVQIDNPLTNGLGFNPILQDPALAIHPPLLYVGYVGFSAVFSLSVATLSLNKKESIAWHIYMKPFVLAAWTFLTIGIALGAFWAYYELGWGGWWFWDPVENASLMPWLLGTALVHSLITVEKKESLQSWVLLLAILTFLLSVTGTFLVRSGILTSVHTFALDPSRGLYILIFTAILGGYSLILFSINSRKYLNQSYFSFLSKEGSILLNNVIMCVVCASVFLGTIYPLIIEAISKNKISVGEPYYNSVVIPILIPAILIMGLGPILSWRKDNLLKTLKKILPNIIITIIFTIIILINYNSYKIYGIIGALLSFWIITNTISIFWQNKLTASKGMMLAHLGVGLLILGITGSSVWQKEKIVRMKINNTQIIQNYNVFFDSAEEIIGPNYMALRGNFKISDIENNLISILSPENRFYPITKSFTSEVSIHTNLFRDFYIVLGEGNINDGWVVRIYHNPLVIWIWIGTFFIFVGGLVSLKKNVKKFKL